MKDDEKLAAVSPSAADPSQAADADPIAALSTRWRAARELRASEVQAALRREYPSATADERILHDLAASDVALGETLAEVEGELAARLLALVNSPKAFAVVARSLREVRACRTSATERVEQLFHAAGTLRAQRRLSGAARLRNVA